MDCKIGLHQKRNGQTSFFWGTIEDLFLLFLTIFALEFCWNVHFFIALWNRRSSIPFLMQTYFTIHHKKPKRCKILLDFMWIIGRKPSCKILSSNYAQKTVPCHHQCLPESLQWYSSLLRAEINSDSIWKSILISNFEISRVNRVNLSELHHTLKVQVRTTWVAKSWHVNHCGRFPSFCSPNPRFVSCTLVLEVR